MSDESNKDDKSKNKLSNFRNKLIPFASVIISGCAAIFAYHSLQTNIVYNEYTIRRGIYDEIIDSFAEDYKSITDCNFSNASAAHYSSFMRSKFIENEEIHALLEEKYNEYNKVKENTESVCKKQKKCLPAREVACEILGKDECIKDGGITDLNENSKPEYNGLLISATGEPLVPVSDKRSSTGTYTGMATMTMQELLECQGYNPTTALENTAIKLQKSFQEVACIMAEDLGINSASCKNNE